MNEESTAALSQAEQERDDSNNAGNVQSGNISNTTVSAPKLSYEASAQDNLKSSNEVLVQASLKSSNEVSASSSRKPSKETSVQTKTDVKPQEKPQIKSESVDNNRSQKTPDNAINAPSSSSKPSDKNTSGGNSSNNTSGNDKTNVSADTKTENKNSVKSADTAAHTHNWKEHTAQRWISNIITFEDEPARYSEKYTLYKMYWYNTGTWEETTDPERFDAWFEDMEGGPLSPISLEYSENPESSPLFLGYDEYGHEVHSGDHAIFPEHYDLIPAVTHEEDHGYYETYVDYYYCDCGAKK